MRVLLLERMVREVILICSFLCKDSRIVLREHELNASHPTFQIEIRLLSRMSESRLPRPISERRPLRIFET